MGGRPDAVGRTVRRPSLSAPHGQTGGVDVAPDEPDTFRALPALGSDIAIPIAVVAVAAVVAAYHGRLVVSDLRLASAQRPTAVAPVAVAQKAATPTVADAPTTLALVLRGQGGEDLEAVADSLREHLPPGNLLEGG